jgi:hypothetical protein
VHGALAPEISMVSKFETRGAIDIE